MLVFLRQPDRQVSNTRTVWFLPLPAALSPPAMPARSSGRSYLLRQRAASSVGSFDAPSSAAHTALSVSASYYSPLAEPSADRQHQAEEDAGERGEEVVVGGKADEAVLSSTDSGVRVGQSVHSGQPPVGPVSRSASDTTSISSRRTRGTLPRYVRDTTVVEQLCTLHTCAHCCKCHLRHNKTGYGRCMKSASTPWPDCECAGKCAAGRCAQPECASNRVVVYLTASPPVPGSQSTLASPAAHSQQQQQQQHDDDRQQPGVSAVSHSSAPSSPLHGARREAGGRPRWRGGACWPTS